MFIMQKKRGWRLTCDLPVWRAMRVLGEAQDEPGTQVSLPLTRACREPSKIKEDDEVSGGETHGEESRCTHRVVSTVALAAALTRRAGADGRGVLRTLGASDFGLGGLWRANGDQPEHLFWEDELSSYVDGLDASTDLV